MLFYQYLQRAKRGRNYGRGVGMFSQLSGNNVAEADSDNDNNNGHNTTKITNESNGVIENDDDEDDGHICLSCSQNDTIVKFTVSDDDDEYITHESHFVEKRNLNMVCVHCTTFIIYIHTEIYAYICIYIYIYTCTQKCYQHSNIIESFSSLHLLTHKTKNEQTNTQIYTNKLNKKQCSAYTHVFVDTIRSIAVFIASILAECIPSITSEEADASAAIAISAIIIVALLPLWSGLRRTWLELYALRREELSEQLHERLMNDTDTDTGTDSVSGGGGGSVVVAMASSSSSSMIDEEGGIGGDYRVTLA